VRIYLYTYVLLLSPADNYPETNPAVQSGFDDLMGHQVRRADTRLFFEISGGIRPENKNRRN
jgi:hypothetical protein